MDDNKMIKTTYPAVRQFTADTGKISRDKHYMRALLEVDVSDALQKLKAIRTRENKVSFLAWFIHILGKCVANHPPIDGVLWKKNTAVTFENVDITTMVEKTVDEKRVPIPLVIRDVNYKSPLEITTEIQRGVDKEIETEKDFVLGASSNDRWLKLAVIVPQGVRVFFLRNFILRHPARVKRMMGTIVVTSLGTQRRIAGWVIPRNIHPLGIGIGSITKKAAVHQGEIKIREILHLTIAIDHDVVDGMPALCFVDELVNMIEAGEGLA
jgi:hypothetical protein